MQTPASGAAEYCREIEAYLCRRNAGHLIRIVGPAFEKVAGWAVQGIPIKVAFRGIDRYVERQEGKGPRRRPVRIEFCEADILDAFDQWRRAVGVGAGAAAAVATATAPEAEAPPEGAAGGSAPRSRRVALQAHIDRVMARLTQRRLEPDLEGALANAIDTILRELDVLRARAHGVRGEARAALLRALQDLDGVLIDAARSVSAPGDLARHESDARRDLQAFKERMPGDAYGRAVAAAAARLLREAVRLPEISAGV